MLKPHSCAIKVILKSHASKVMLKILQARLQQYVNDELPDVQASFMFYFSLLRKIFFNINLFILIGG